MSLSGRSIKVPHTGTFNANPLSAAAGIAMLRHLADGTPQTQVARNAEALVATIEAAARAAGVDVGAYQQGGILHVMIGARTGGYPSKPSGGVFNLARVNARAYDGLRKALLVHGVDMHSVHGWLATVHSAEVIEEIGSAFAGAFDLLRRESAVPCLA
jgi:glutamate-1-semialdehyde 2,1-aminomutase